MLKYSLIFISLFISGSSRAGEYEPFLRFKEGKLVFSQEVKEAFCSPKTASQESQYLKTQMQEAYLEFLNDRNDPTRKIELDSSPELLSAFKKLKSALSNVRPNENEIVVALSEFSELFSSEANHFRDRNGYSLVYTLGLILSRHSSENTLTLIGNRLNSDSLNASENELVSALFDAGFYQTDLSVFYYTFAQQGLESSRAQRAIPLFPEFYDWTLPENHFESLDFSRDCCLDSFRASFKEELASLYHLQLAAQYDQSLLNRATYLFVEKFFSELGNMLQDPGKTICDKNSDPNPTGLSDVSGKSNSRWCLENDSDYRAEITEIAIQANRTGKHMISAGSDSIKGFVGINGKYCKIEGQYILSKMGLDEVVLVASGTLIKKGDKADTSLEFNESDLAAALKGPTHFRVK
jgi:hypothetical protein